MSVIAEHPGNEGVIRHKTSLPVHAGKTSAKCLKRISVSAKSVAAGAVKFFLIEQLCNDDFDFLSAISSRLSAMMTSYR